MADSIIPQATAAYAVSIPTGQWSGSGSDRYITVNANNVTADSILIPQYDHASEALLKGPVWCVPAAGSFTIHTTDVPTGTVSLVVLMSGIVGEAQYQVLADVYSKAQTDALVIQSTVTLDADTYNSGSAIVYKVGRICYISCIAGSWSNNGAGTAIYTSGKSGWVLPEGFRPKINCEIRETLVGKRITVLTTGEVSCPEAISGVNLRFSGCYINA